MRHENTRFAQSDGTPTGARTPNKTFVVPFSDETPFSILARHHLLHEPCAPTELIKRFFGSRNRKVDSPFPSGLSHFYRTAPAGLWRDLGDFLEHHSLLPYYRPFLGPDASKKLAGMPSQFTLKPKDFFSFAKGSNSQALPKYCPACVQDDFYLRGQPYWHRAHQIPGVVVCPEHLVRLIDRCPQCDTSPNQGALLYLPQIRCVCGHVCSPEPERPHANSAPSVASTLAAFSVAILNGEVGHFHPSLLVAFYRHMLRERRYYGRHQQNKERLWQDIQNTYTTAFLNEIGLGSTTGACPQWFTNLTVHSAAIRRYPLHHIVLLTFLFQSFPLFTEALFAFEREQKAPRTSKGVSRKLRGENDSQLLDKLRILIVTEKKSLNAAARELDVTPYTVGVLVRAAALLPTAQEKQHKDQTILDDLRAGLQCVEVEKKHSVSKRRVMDLLQSRPALVKARRLIRNAATLQHHKDQVMEILSRNPGTSRKTLRSELTRSYKYLCQWDKGWLDKELLSQQQVSTTGRLNYMVNWTQRDDQMASQLRNTHDKLVRSSARPALITKCRLLREAGIMNKAYSNLSKLPRTAELLRKLIDTPESFNRRKIAWAIRELVKSEASVTRRAVILKAWVRPKFLFLIDEICSPQQIVLPAMA